MLSHVYSEGRHCQVLKDISDHSADGSALKRIDGFITSRDRKRQYKKTTRGCILEVERKDGTIIWIPLNDVKDSNHVGLAKCAVANNIYDEPAFKWWMKNVLCKRDRIISKVKAKYWRTTQTFGIQFPKTVDGAYKIYHRMDTTSW